MNGACCMIRPCCMLAPFSVSPDQTSILRGGRHQAHDVELRSCAHTRVLSKRLHEEDRPSKPACRMERSAWVSGRLQVRSREHAGPARADAPRTMQNLVWTRVMSCRTLVRTHRRPRPRETQNQMPSGGETAAKRISLTDT